MNKTENSNNSENVFDCPKWCVLHDEPNDIEDVLHISEGLAVPLVLREQWIQNQQVCHQQNAVNAVVCLLQEAGVSYISCSFAEDIVVDFTPESATRLIAVLKEVLMQLNS